MENINELELIINILQNIKGEVKNLAEKVITRGCPYTMTCIDKDIENLENLLIDKRIAIERRKNNR